MKKRLSLLVLLFLCQLCHLLASLQMLIGIVIGSPRVWTLAVSYDQLGNVIVGGDEDFTISAHAWAHRAVWRWSVVVRFLDFLEAGHCKNAYDKEIEKRLAK